MQNLNAADSQDATLEAGYSPDQAWEKLTRLLNKTMSIDEIDEAHRVASGLLSWMKAGRNQPDRLSPHVGRKAFTEIVAALVVHIECKLDVERS